MKRYCFLLLALVVLVSCKPSETLIFEENFDGNSLNESVWNYELGNGCPTNCGWGNNERQFYTKENISVKDGHLVITASKDSTAYFSGRITTSNKFEFQYGTIKVRAKLAKGQGVWPAIWMLGSNIDTVGWPASGEIDIMEYVGKNPHEIHTTLHTTASHGNSENTKITTLKTIEDGFHVYSCTWDATSIRFFIDEQLVYTFSPKDKNKDVWPYDQPFFVILNLAIGGNFGGPEVDDSIFPEQFIVDYVRVYK